jgi:hypothetical protein
MPGVRVLGLGPVSGRLDSQVGGWGYDAGSTMGAEGEQVFVAGNDEGGVGALGAFEDFVVVGVAAEVDGVAEGDADGASDRSLQLGLYPLKRPSELLHQNSRNLGVDFVAGGEEVGIDSLLQRVHRSSASASEL